MPLGGARGTLFYFAYPSWNVMSFLITLYMHCGPVKGGSGFFYAVVVNIYTHQGVAENAPGFRIPQRRMREGFVIQEVVFLFEDGAKMRC